MAMDEFMLDYVAGLVADDLLDLIEEKYNPRYARQPRDRHGRWTSGPLARLVGPTLVGMSDHDPRRGQEPTLNKPEPKPRPKPKAPPKKPAGGGAGTQMPGAGPGVAHPGGSNPPSSGVGIKDGVKYEASFKDLSIKHRQQIEETVTEVHALLPGLKLEVGEHLSVGTISEASQKATRMYYGFEAAGQYQPSKTKTISIAAGAEASGDRKLVMAHEMGHWIDNIVGSRIHNSDPNRKYDDNSAEGSEDSLHYAQGNRTSWVKEAIWNSPSYKKLADAEERHNTSGGQKYYTRSNEIFARAFSQYVASKSQDASFRKSPLYPGRIRTHWQEEEFKPISDAFDAMFSNLGWRSKE